MIKTKKTEVHKKTNSPTFNESFHFKVPNGNLDTISVSITVMQHAQAIKGKETNQLKSSAVQSKNAVCALIKHCRYFH